LKNTIVRQEEAMGEETFAEKNETKNETKRNINQKKMKALHA